jgi:hypothetical protein
MLDLSGLRRIRNLDAELETSRKALASPCFGAAAAILPPLDGAALVLDELLPAFLGIQLLLGKTALPQRRRRRQARGDGG